MGAYARRFARLYLLVSVALVVAFLATCAAVPVGATTVSGGTDSAHAIVDLASAASMPTGAGQDAAEPDEDGYVPFSQIPCVAGVEFTSENDDSIATLVTRNCSSQKRGHFGVGFTVTNECDVALTSIRFGITCYDANGDAIDPGYSPHMHTQSFLEDPLAPGESRDFGWPYYFADAGLTASFELVPAGVETELTLPPWTDPQPFNSLVDFCNYAPVTDFFEDFDKDPPVELRYHRDQMYDETVADLELIRAAARALESLTIADETFGGITDMRQSYWFVFEDGTEFGFSFETPWLFEWHGATYMVLNPEVLANCGVPAGRLGARGR